MAVAAPEHDSAQSMGHRLLRLAETSPDRTFVASESGSLSYAEAEVSVRRLANGFAAAGLRKGSRVSVMLPNCLEFVLTSIALSWIGCVEIPLNTALKGRVLTHQLVDSDAEMLVVLADFDDSVAGAWTTEVGITGLVVVGEASRSAFERLSGINRVHDFGRLSDIEPICSNPVGVDPRDISAVMYTSGTTGPSKGVVVSYAHAETFARDWMRAVGFTSADVLLTPLPLFHSIARTLGLLPVLLVGAEINIRPRFSASRFWEQACESQATVVHGVFGMVPILLNQPPSPSETAHRVRAFYIGPSAWDAAFRARFGVKVIEVYGSTETGVVTMAPENEGTPAGSCGKPNEETFEVSIFDESDVPVATGVVGEIVVRPKKPLSVTCGYHANSDATLQAFRNLWFHTGDLARRDADGFYYFVDRQKDAMRRRGENISSVELESIANTHPELFESAAIGVPSPLGEDDVLLLVVLANGSNSFDFDEFIAFCGEHMPDFMIPRYVEVLEEFPKTENGKVQKGVLRRRGSHGLTSATWDREAKGATNRRG